MQQGIAFIPLVAETSGGWGPSGMCTLETLARAAATRSDNLPKSILAEHLQLLCTGIRRANARAVLRRDHTLGDIAPSAAFSALNILVGGDAGASAA